MPYFLTSHFSEVMSRPIIVPPKPIEPAPLIDPLHPIKKEEQHLPEMQLLPG